MMTCFRNDTPIEMAKSDQSDELAYFMNKMYNDQQVVKERIEEI